MKSLTLASLLLLFTGAAIAQTATLAAPETMPNRVSLIVGQVHEYRADPNDAATANKVTVIIWKLDALGARADVVTVNLTTGAELSGFLAAVETPLAGEPTGTTLAVRSRRHNGRILNYVVKNCATFAAPCTSQLSTALMVP